MSAMRNAYRTARLAVVVVAALLVVGVVASFMMGNRALDTAEQAATLDATIFTEQVLPSVFTADDLAAAVSPTRAKEIGDELNAHGLGTTGIGTVTLWTDQGTVVFSTDRIQIGDTRPDRIDRIHAALKDGSLSQVIEGQYTTLVPFALKSGETPTAVAEFDRSYGTLFASSAKPWRMVAIGIGVLFIVSLFGIWRISRAAASAAANMAFRPSQGLGEVSQAPEERAAAPKPKPTGDPPIYAVPGFKEESQARLLAEQRAKTAEDQLTQLQEQYRQTLEDMQAASKSSAPAPVARPANEERMLKAEGRIRLLEGELHAIVAERDKLAKDLTEARAREAQGPDPEVEARLRQFEQEGIAMRAELEGARTELEVAKRELASQQTRANELQTEIEGARAAEADAVSVRSELEAAREEAGSLRASAAEAEQLRATLEMARTTAEQAGLDVEEAGAQLEATRRELEDARAELRVLRGGEERATVLDEQLASLRGELETAKAKHREHLETSKAKHRGQMDEARARHQEELAAKEAEIDALLEQGRAEGRAEAESALASRDADLASRDTELEALRAELEHARGDLASYEGEATAARSELGSAREELTAATQGLEEAQTRMTAMEDEVAAAQGELHAHDTELAAAQAAVEAIGAELEAARGELTEAQAEIQTELARGVELVERAERAERELAGLSTGESTGAGAGLEQVLKVTQERLAGNAEKLVEMEDRARAAEGELAGALARLEETERELARVEMEGTFRELQDADAVDAARTGSDADGTGSADVLEDRRVSTPYMKELSLDAKKTLTQILGVTLTLKHKKSPQEQAPLLRQLAAFARRLDHAVTDLADADKIARGTIELNVRRTNLGALIERVVEESGIGTDHDIRVETEELVVAVDPLRTEQILNGLLRGSAERTPPGSQITVRLSHADGGALLSVEDREPSSDASMSPVVARLAAVQDGWAKVEGRPNGGSAFRVFLPDKSPGGPTPLPLATASAGEDQNTDTETAPDRLEIVVENPQDMPESAESAGSPETVRGSFDDADTDDPWAAGQLLVQELQRLSRED